MISFKDGRAVGRGVLWERIDETGAIGFRVEASDLVCR